MMALMVMMTVMMQLRIPTLIRVRNNVFCCRREAISLETQSSFLAIYRLCTKMSTNDSFKSVVVFAKTAPLCSEIFSILTKPVSTNSISVTSVQVSFYLIVRIRNKENLFSQRFSEQEKKILFQ